MFSSERMVKWVQDRLLGLVSDWDELLNFAAEDFQEFRLVSFYSRDLENKAMKSLFHKL